MKSKLLSVFLMATMWLSGTSVMAQSGLTTNEEGAYLIGSREDLQTWTKTPGYEKSNVVLTADIANLDFRLCTTTAYTGTFDGDGHTVTLNYDFAGEQAAMFVSCAGTVKNLIVDGNINATYKNCAALVGTASGVCSFENVMVLTSIYDDCGGNASNAGFIGYTNKPSNFTNCLSAIKASGVYGYNHGFVGWIGSNAETTFNNCVSIMEADVANSMSYGNPTGSIKATNCYSYQQDLDPATALGGTSYITSDKLASGEICYLLNKNAGKTVFYQTLGEDKYPVPFSTHKQVYGNGNLRCDGTLIDGEITYSNTEETQIPPHTDVDGRCTVCGNLLPDHIATDEDGFYPLATAKDVEWFGALVNEAHMTTIKGKLTADIDYEGVENAHTPIGLNDTYKFNGVFDGQGHRIKNMILTSTGNGLGFFGIVRGASVIRNLIIDKSCEISGAGQVGALIGAVQTKAESPLLIENCVNEATVVGTGAAAGIIGAGKSGYPDIKLVNCLNTGDITGSPATALCSWINHGGCSLTNCVNTGLISGMDNAGGKFGYNCNLIRYEPGTTTLTNCYDASETEECGQGIDGDWTTENPAAGGELCYLLNGDQTAITWYQKIGTDAYPVPYYIEGGVVYANGEVGCDGLPVGDVTYSNVKTGDIPPHEYEDGFCVNCDAPQLDYAELVNGFYQIGNASQLYWLSRMVNDFGHTNWNAQLTENIDMDMYSDLFIPIGTSPAYSGHFDGQGHVISNLNVNAGGNNVGLFGLVGQGVIIENLLLDESCSITGSGDRVALVGAANQAGSVTLRNLGNMGNVFGGGKQTAGIFGGNDGSRASIVIENCFSTGSIEGVNECAAITGWAGSNSPKVSNCWTCSEVTGIDKPSVYMVRASNGTVTNLYATTGEQGAIIDYDDITNGSLCYKLNGDQTTIAWYQNIDNGETPDDQPVPFANGHARVFPKGKMLCDGTVDPTSVVYSNVNESVIPDHHFEGGFCTVCGQEDPDYDGFIKVIKNADFNTDAYAWDGTGFSVNNGVAMNSGKTFDTYQALGKLQPGVYRLRVQGFSRSASLDDDIYASGELSEDIQRNSYIYVECDGKRVARRLMDITADANGYKLNDGVGETMLTNEMYVPTSNAAIAKYLSKGRYWNELYFAVTADSLRIGFSNQIASTSVQTVVDRLRLEYVGDDESAYAHIAAQITADAQELGDLEGQENLKEEYQEIVDKAQDMTDAAEILAAADKASRYPDIIKLSVDAYVSYNAVVADLQKFWNDNSDKLAGTEAADRLETYLMEEEGPSEIYPNGTSLYIKEYRFVGIEELKAEEAFAQELLNATIKESGATGMDVTSLINNPRFTKGEWEGWTVERTHSLNGWNMVDNGGFRDIFPTAAGYNTAFEVSQEITGIQNGIYELQAYAFHRPGTNAQGIYDGTDIIPAHLFMNGYNTPVMSVYADILDYSEAMDGINCRIDPNNPDAPHSGEETGRKDFDTGLGYVPDDMYSASFSFNGGRYIQKAYAIVTDGTLRLGIRNGENPWRDKNLTVWGDFRLTYQGNSEEAISAILKQYSERVDLLELQRVEQNHNYSQEHIDNINSLIAQAGQAATAEEKMKAIASINEEFNLIDSSVVIYQKLEEIYEYANDMVEGLEDGEMKSFMENLWMELSDVLPNGTYTDKQAQEKIDELMGNKFFGGVIYVQGDLYDEASENGEWDYSRMCTLYPLYQDADGKWTGTVTLQDRSREANSRQRAGFYFRRVNTIYKCNDGTASFLTPSRLSFGVQEGGADFQALCGTYDITLDLENMTVDYELKDEYKWDNQVYVTGTLVNRSGAVERWKNTEQWPLQHVGNGRYVGTVDMVLDNSNPYCSFGIIACRSNTEAVNYSTTAHSSWTEARYGTKEQYYNLTSGELADSLVRGQDLTWRIAPAGRYLIEFDMDNATMRATLLETKGQGTEANPYLIANAADLQSMQDRMVDNQTTYFKLTSDVDLNGAGWYPLNSTVYGNSSECGEAKYVNLDGDGHVIKNVNIAAGALGDYSAGFFANLCGSVSNLGMYNVTLTGSKAAANGVLAGTVGNSEYEGTTSVTNSYFNGVVDTEGAAGGIAGMILGQTTVANCYANASIMGDAAGHGDLVGDVEAGLTITDSYAGGFANGSEAKGILGEGETCEMTNVLRYDGTNREALGQTVSAWAAWNANGEAGNGYPILEWQAQRGDQNRLCGYEDPSGIDYVLDNRTGSSSDAYTIGGVRAGKNARGIIIQDGRKILKK